MSKPASMFSLDTSIAKLTSVNPRVHGQDHKMAADLKFEIKGSNDILSEFDPALKSALYKKADGAQGELINEPGHLPALRFPLMGTVKWGKVFAGYTTTVHYGVSGRDDIILVDCEVGGFRFDCQDGGTVVTSFRVIIHPEHEALGRLCEMIQQEVEISMEPPEAEPS